MGKKQWRLVCGVCGLACAVVHGEVRHLLAFPGDHAATVAVIHVEPQHKATIDHTHADVEGFVALELPGDIAAITTASGGIAAASNEVAVRRRQYQPAYYAPAVSDAPVLWYASSSSSAKSEGM